MIRKVLTAIALTATLGGCVTGYGYREGAGDYYYGSPSVEYDYYGAPYGSTYYGGGLGYGYGGYGYGGGYGGGFGYGGYGYGGYPYYYGVPYYYYVPRPSHPPRGGWDGNGPRQGTRPGHPPPTASRPFPGYPKNVGPDAEPNGRIRRQGGAFVPQRIGQDSRPVPRQWAPAERGGNPRSQQQPAQRMFQRPEASNFESRQRPTQQQPFRSSPRPSAAPMRSAPAPSPASAPRGGDFRRNQDR